jgi:ABC-type spermidine/putrescine transport system permease subunit II
MSDTTLIPPAEDKTPPSYATEPPRNVEYATIPPDITLKPDLITLKRPFFIGSVLIMVLVGLITFWMPFFNGLLAGTFGGYHAGRMKRALAAAVVCSVVVPALLAGLSFFSEQPSLLFLMGLTFKEWIVAHVLGTFLGAISGAASRPLFTERELYGSV